MATRSQTTFKKRQKEIARVDKQREKMEKRIERKDRETAPEPEVSLEEASTLRS